MTTRHTRFTSRIAMIVIASFVSSPIAQLSAQVQPAATQAAKTPPAAAAVPAEPDGGWPRAKQSPAGAAVVVYQPQVAEWTNQKEMVAYAAVSYTPKGDAKPTLGTLRLEAKTSVAMDERLVNFTELKVTQSNFSSLSRDQLQAAVADIMASLSLEDRVLGLDRVLANIDASQFTPKNVEGVKADPPPIFFSKTPAALVNIDTDPIWSPIPQNDLQHAVNTNWDLFQHVPTNTLYLRNEKVWMKATDVKGPWVPAGKLPESFKKLPEDENWKEVKDSLPGKSVSASQAPKIYVSTVPAEMILLKGEPAYATVTGAPTLLWVSNTDSDIFRMGKTGLIYFLVSGRWFSAPDFTGPWTFATPNLPADFKLIPLEHERSRVLASVPGTTQAAEAILLAQIPQTARVSKKLAPPDVVYQGGAPQFQPIEKTTVQRAVNTDKDILKVGDLYYMCFQGVWFVSTTPNGVWQVTGTVPKEIYEIPVSSPSYSVTYVTVEEDDDDAVVFATAMAFTGVMIAWGCVMWGSGYYYPPYIYRGGMYPAYYGHYPTYGFGASYNPWTGAYSRGAVAYGPYGGAGVGARYNPRTGTYSRGAAAYGPYGSRGAASAYNPRTGAYGTTRQGSNVYGSWGSTSVARGDSWANTARVTNNATGNTTRVTQGSGGGGAVTRNTPGPGGGGVARTGSGDVYAGKDGNVYRKNDDGNFQQYGDGGWSDTARQPGDTRPTPTGTGSTGRGGSTGTTGSGGRTGAATTPANKPNWDPDTSRQVTRDSAARADGAQRTKDLGSVRSGSTSRSGSFRPSGGGGRSRGGGRGRMSGPAMFLAEIA